LFPAPHMLRRFHLIPERHGQTDRIAVSISRVSVLTRDKNRTIAVIVTQAIYSPNTIHSDRQHTIYQVTLTSYFGTLPVRHKPIWYGTHCNKHSSMTNTTCSTPARQNRLNGRGHVTSGSRIKKTKGQNFITFYEHGRSTKIGPIKDRKRLKLRRSDVSGVWTSKWQHYYVYCKPHYHEG